MLGSKTVRDGYLAEIIAERLSVDDGQEESALDRGVRLESYAIQAFESETGKLVTPIGFVESSDSEFIALSPDGFIENNGVYDEAIEVKCLSAANHIQAWLKNEVPKDYYPQVIQYFIANDDLKTVYFVLYDPRVTMKPIHIIEIHRKDVEKDITDFRAEELKFINEVEEAINKLVPF